MKWICIKEYQHEYKNPDKCKIGDIVSDELMQYAISIAAVAGYLSAFWLCWMPLAEYRNQRINEILLDEGQDEQS